MEWQWKDLFARLIEWMGYEAWSGRGYKGSCCIFPDEVSRGGETFVETCHAGISIRWRKGEGDFAQGSFEIHEQVSRFRDEIVQNLIF